MLGISSTVSAGGYGKGYYGYAPAHSGSYHPYRHSGYRYGYRKGYRHGSRYSRGPYYRYRSGYRKGYRHGYRHARRSYYPRQYYGYYRPAPVYYPAGVTLHFDF
ncbi:MAG: hypothetical protein AAF446_09455 [Pseudomonadota bacterium]